MGDLSQIDKALEGIEEKLIAFAEKSDSEIKDAKDASVETKNALEALGEEQHAMAKRLLAMEQRNVGSVDGAASPDSWGKQFIESDKYKHFIEGGTNKVRYEVKNTITGGDATVAPDRQSGVVPGAFNPLTLEQFLFSLPTASNAVEYTKEASFTNSAAEAAEAAEKAESAITFSLVNMPISTVAHWLKISRQLAADNTALAVYVDRRMRYGVDRKVETQLVSGDGTSPNISGILDSGNFTAHGYASGDLGATLPKLVLINKMKYDSWAAGYLPDGVLLNPADWGGIENDLLTTTSNATRVNYMADGTPMLFGMPVILSVGMTADNVAVGSFREAYTVYNREGVVVQMSDSDDDNFTKNLITIRAERRLALASEVPGAVRAGDLTPV